MKHGKTALANSLFVEIAEDEEFTPRQRSEILEGCLAEVHDPREREHLERLIETVRDEIDDPPEPRAD